MLGKNGKLYDTKKGQNLPEGIPPMPLLTEVIPFQDAERAFTLAADRSRAMKVQLAFS